MFPRNLKLSSEYKLIKVGEVASSSGEKQEEPDQKNGHLKGFQWVLCSSDPANVKVESSWKSLQADGDVLTKSMYLKGRIATGMQALLEALPHYSDKDLVVVHRKTDKGIWRDELWTRRDFQALELQLAPVSSQIKDSHLMASGHAVVSLPKHGRGAHPENLTLALDGRSRNLMAAKGALDPEEHRGSLYWLVTRTSKLQDVNLEIDNVSWEQEIKVSLPGPKRRKTETLTWTSSELPTFPLLVNKKAIKKHTQLCVFLAEKKKDDKGNKK